ncbi:MAG: transposase [Acidobacteria bacterium]|nr:transposase [Acidobacteriota bacterium]
MPAHDRQRLERLCRCVARPALAAERLARLDDGRLLYQLKRRWRDGTSALLFQPHERSRAVYVELLAIEHESGLLTELQTLPTTEDLWKAAHSGDSRFDLYHALEVRRLGVFGTTPRIRTELPLQRVGRADVLTAIYAVLTDLRRHTRES